VIGLPPFEGAVQVTTAEALPAVALTPVGVPGADTVAGVTGLECADSALVPTAFVADTVKVYVVPSVSPVTATLVEGGLPLTDVGACAVVPMYGVTVYRVMGLPPLEGAVQLTTAEPLPAVAVTAVGAAGGPAGVTAADCDEGRPVPTALVADTVKVYAVPLVNPVTVPVVAGGLPVTVVPGWATPPMYGVIE
jgi:hypothetical protein